MIRDWAPPGYGPRIPPPLNLRSLLIATFWSLTFAFVRYAKHLGALASPHARFPAFGSFGLLIARYLQNLGALRCFACCAYKPICCLQTTCRIYYRCTDACTYLLRMHLSTAYMLVIHLYTITSTSNALPIGEHSCLYSRSAAVKW